MAGLKINRKDRLNLQSIKKLNINSQNFRIKAKSKKTRRKNKLKVKSLQILNIRKIRKIRKML
jgi:hypothetical protein